MVEIVDMETHIRVGKITEKLNIELKNNENLMVKSPCQFICVLEDDVCIGCKRTKEEISKWSKYTDEDKQNVLNRIKTNEKK